MSVRDRRKDNLEVCKTFTFEAAHRLPYHDGKCAQLHGHSYKVMVCLRGNVQQRGVKENPEEGMVIDFGRIKDAWKKLEPKLDHKNINEIIVNPTAENLCIWLVQKFDELFPDIVISRLRVHETETSYVEWTLDWS